MSEDTTAVNQPVEEQTTPTESAPEEKKELEVVREGEAVEPDLYEKSSEEETEGDTESEESEQEAEETADEKPLGAKGQRRLQQLANQVRDLKEYIKTLEQVQPQVEQYDVDKAIEEKGLTPEQARIEALEQNQKNWFQQQQAMQEQNRLAELNAAVLTDAENVVRDFPELNEASDQYDPDLTARIMDMWHTAADVQYMTDSNGQVVTDNNGQPIIENARISLYNFVENINAIGKAKYSKGSVEGQKAAEKNLAAVEVRPTAKPKQSNKDDSQLSADEYAKKYGLSTVR